jgi:hypothetical protein
LNFQYTIINNHFEAPYKSAPLYITKIISPQTTHRNKFIQTSIPISLTNTLAGLSPEEPALSAVEWGRHIGSRAAEAAGKQISNTPSPDGATQSALFSFTLSGLNLLYYLRRRLTHSGYYSYTAPRLQKPLHRHPERSRGVY